MKPSITPAPPALAPAELAPAPCAAAGMPRRRAAPLALAPYMQGHLILNSRQLHHCNKHVIIRNKHDTHIPCQNQAQDPGSQKPETSFVCMYISYQGLLQ